MASTATGMTMAISVNAASTSTSVKAARARLTAGLGRIVGLNLIFKAIGAFHDPGRIVLALPKSNAFRAALTDKTVGRKTNHRHIAHTRHDLVQRTRLHGN